MPRYTLNVNGKPEKLEAEADSPLLYVLRDQLELHGPKFGCGMAQCGACTVHIDGQAVRSCVMPVSAVGAKKVTTLEGLAVPPSPRPCSKPSSTSRPRNAATVSTAWSCRRRIC